MIARVVRMPDGLFLARLLLCVEAAWWATALALPGDTFSVSRAYAGLARSMPEGGWAALCAGQAMLGAVGLLRQPGLLRVAAAMTAGLLHARIAMSFLEVWPPSTGTGTHVLFMLLAWWVVAVEARR